MQGLPTGVNYNLLAGLSGGLGQRQSLAGGSPAGGPPMAAPGPSAGLGAPPMAAAGSFPAQAMPQPGQAPGNGLMQLLMGLGPSAGVAPTAPGMSPGLAPASQLAALMRRTS